MYTILSIEDDSINRSLLRRYLKVGNYRLLEAVSGEEGIRIAADQQPDLIICDIHLPDRNGREVLAAIRQDEGLADVPAIALTADNTRILRKQTLSEGFNAHLTKPVSVATLHMTINELLLLPTASDGASILHRSTKLSRIY